MTPRSLKLLTASTAFIAAASAAQAQNIINTPLTATQYTSETGAFTLTSPGSIATTAAPAIEISSTSATSNTITIGTGTSVTASDNASATIISTNADNAAVTINVSGTVASLSGTTGAIDLTGMTNGATIRNTGTISGSITLGDGANNVSSSGTTVGDIIGGTSVDTITLTNATHTGEIYDARNNDNDVLNLNGTQTFTTGGDIEGMETVNVNTGTTLNHALIGTQTMNIATEKTLQSNRNFTVGGTITNNGNLNIAAGKVVTADDYVGNAGSTLGIAIASSNTTVGMGQLVLANSGAFTADTSVTINVADTAGYIGNGTQYTIVDGDAAAGNAALTNTGTAVYSYSTATAGNNVILTINRTSLTEIVDTKNTKTVADVLEELGASSTGELETLQSVIANKATAASVKDVIESLAPNIDGAGVASVNFAVDSANQVSNRLASLRGGEGYGVATGDGMDTRHMWVQGFGSILKQDDKDGARGYDANSAGATIGFDTDRLVNGMTTGLAVSYGNTKVDSNASGGAKTDVNNYAATLYGSRVMDNGVFLNGQLGAGYNQYDMQRTVSGIGQTKGETQGWQGTAKLETGRDFAMGGLTLTPLASVQYTYLEMEGYTETGAGGASLWVKPDAMSTFDAGLGFETSYAFALANGGTFKPSLHAKYIYRMGDDSMTVTSQFLGGGSAFVTNGVEADDTSINLGGGLLLTTWSGTDFSLNYDADIRKSLIGHTGQVKARWAF